LVAVSNHLKGWCVRWMSNRATPVRQRVGPAIVLVQRDGYNEQDKWNDDYKILEMPARILSTFQPQCPLIPWPITAKITRYKQAKTRKKTPIITSFSTGGTPTRRTSGWYTWRVTYGETEFCAAGGGKAVISNAVL